jgi:hypothetical protein
MKKYSVVILLLVLIVSEFQLFADTSVINASKIELFSSDSLWNLNLGLEYPGAKGYFDIKQVEHSKELELQYDFTGGGSYVGIGANVQIPTDLPVLEFGVRSGRDIQIGVKIVDSKDQTHAIFRKIQAGQEAQKVTILTDELESDDYAMHFGNENDGTVHFPIKVIQFFVNNIGKQSSDNDEKNEGSVFFSEAYFRVK